LYIGYIDWKKKHSYNCGSINIVKNLVKTTILNIIYLTRLTYYAYLYLYVYTYLKKKIIMTMKGCKKHLKNK